MEVWEEGGAEGEGRWVERGGSAGSPRSIGYVPMPLYRSESRMMMFVPRRCGADGGCAARRFDTPLEREQQVRPHPPETTHLKPRATLPRALSPLRLHLCACACLPWRVARGAGRRAVLTCCVQVRHDLRVRTWVAWQLGHTFNPLIGAACMLAEVPPSPDTSTRSTCSSGELASCLLLRPLTFHPWWW